MGRYIKKKDQEEKANKKTFRVALGKVRRPRDLCTNCRVHRSSVLKKNRGTRKKIKNALKQQVTNGDIVQPIKGKWSKQPKKRQSGNQQNQNKQMQPPQLRTEVESTFDPNLLVPTVGTHVSTDWPLRMDSAAPSCNPNAPSQPMQCHAVPRLLTPMPKKKGGAKPKAKPIKAALKNRKNAAKPILRQVRLTVTMKPKLKKQLSLISAIKDIKLHPSKYLKPKPKTAMRTKLCIDPHAEDGNYMRKKSMIVKMKPNKKKKKTEKYDLLKIAEEFHKAKGNNSQDPQTSGNQLIPYSSRIGHSFSIIGKCIVFLIKLVKQFSIIGSSL